MILGIHHTAIVTLDIEKLSKFYCDVLGMVKVAEDQWSGSDELDAIVDLPGSAARFMLLSAGNQFIEMFQYLSPIAPAGDPNRPVCNPGITHFCLGVSDIDAEYERMSAAGMRFHTPPGQTGGRPLRATYGRDPDGNVIELLEVTGDTPFNYTPTTPHWRR